MLQSYPDRAEIAGIINGDISAHSEADWQQVLQSNAAALAEIEWLKSFILGVRRIRAERDIAPRKPLDLKVSGGSADEQRWLQENLRHIQALTSVTGAGRVDAVPDDAISAQAGSMTLMVPLADLIDPLAEIEKLQKQLAQLETERERLRTKLQNWNFIDKAPSQIVQKERDKLAEAETAAGRLVEQIERMRKGV